LEAVASLDKKLSKKPRHIPESLVYDFDMFSDTDYRNDPHARMIELKKEAPPIFWTRCNGGYWIVQGYQATQDIVGDSGTFSNAIIPESRINVVKRLFKLLSYVGVKTPNLPKPYPISIDPPMHAQYRQPLQGVFSPKNVKTLEDRLRLAAQELIDEIKDKGRCEFMSAVAEPLPVRLFLEIFGLPVEKMPEYRSLLKKQLKLVSQRGSNFEKLSSLSEIVEVIRCALLERKDNPKDDLISLLWQSKIDGRSPTFKEMEGYGVLLFIAGLDTVVNSIGCAMRHLAMHPDLQQHLREHPERISDAVEEILRRYAIALPPRRVTESAELHGVKFRKNDVLYLFLHGANLDPAQFKNPERVDIDRSNARRHLTFNTGPHHCLGAYLARLELRVVYEEMLSRVPVFRLDEERPPVFDCGLIVGMESLDLVW